MGAVPVEASSERRFEFGKNWRHYIAYLDSSKLASAVSSLTNVLGDIRGTSFLDAGSGSGLFSLAAVQLGARVTSFDCDRDSVECTRQLKAVYEPAQINWTIHTGSALDKSFLQTLGQFDVVYSWGVLHHTGDMWTALDNVTRLVKPGGRLWVAIYNDQGPASSAWKFVKRMYNTGPVGKTIVLPLGFALCVMRALLADGLRMRNPLSRFLRHRNRGMDFYHDVIDWLGGWPFEVAKPEQVFTFCAQRGLTLSRLYTCAGRAGCNEFVFRNSR